MGKVLRTLENTDYKHIAVYGGSFNPITYSHLMILTRCSEFTDIDCIIIEPVGDRYTEKKNLKSYDFRSTIIEGALHSVIHDLDIDVYIGDFESKEFTQPTTRTTLNHYGKMLPNTKVSYICGADVLASMKGWGGDVTNLVDEHELYVIDRVEMKNNIEFDIINESPMLFRRRKHIHIIPAMTFNSISSTLVRNRIQNDMSIIGLVPHRIITMIRDVYK